VEIRCRLFKGRRRCMGRKRTTGKMKSEIRVISPTYFIDIR